MHKNVNRTSDLPNLDPRDIGDESAFKVGAQYTFPTIAAYLAAAGGTNPRGYTTFTQAVGNSALDYNSRFTSF